MPEYTDHFPTVRSVVVFDLVGLGEKDGRGPLALADLPVFGLSLLIGHPARIAAREGAHVHAENEDVDAVVALAGDGIEGSLRPSGLLCVLGTDQELHAVSSSAVMRLANSCMGHDEAWQQSSACYRMVSEADGVEMPDRERSDFELSAKYLFQDYPRLPPDTRGSVYATYSVLAEVLLRGQMADLFDSGTNFLPELTFEGAIIVLDLPTKTYGKAGVLLQSAFLHLWQQACKQRGTKVNPRPVFLFVDEFQELINAYTPRFLATSRSARVAPILISQNRPNYLAALGGEHGRHLVDAFLGNIGTKVFHANGDGFRRR